MATIDMAENDMIDSAVYCVLMTLIYELVLAKCCVPVRVVRASKA